MAYTTYPKGSKCPSDKYFDTQKTDCSWNEGHDISSKAASNYKVKKLSPANPQPQKREWPKKGLHQDKFGTVK